MKTFTHLKQMAALALMLLIGTTAWGAAINTGASHLSLTSEDGAAEITDTYKIYQCNFNTPNYAPFRDAWAWSPSYIRAENGYCEFYYNQEACDNDNRRMRRGCELATDFSTQSQGWYGYKLYLPSDGMSKDLKGTIITQFFQGGSRNSWAGHLDIDGENLQLQYRNALVDPVKKTVGKLEWDTWQNIIVYFRVGKNNKGCIKVWLGEGELNENDPTLVCEGINFGFANNWIDNTHQDPTPYTVDGKEYTDALGGKWGFYVSQGGDRKMRLDNLSVLEGNPEGAFEMVNPKNEPAANTDLNTIIMNADCSSMTGWTSSVEGTWATNTNNGFDNNSNNTYFQIWTGGNAPACKLYQTITLNKGHYRLSVDGIASTNGENAESSAGKAVLYVTINGNTTEAVFHGHKKAATTAAVEFEVTTDGTSVELGAMVKEDSDCKWVAVDNFSIIDLDVPSKIVNADCSSLSGWTVKDISAKGTYFEYWKSAANASGYSLSQTLTNQEPGYYLLTVNAFCRPTGRLDGQKDNDATSINNFKNGTDMVGACLYAKIGDKEVKTQLPSFFSVNGYDVNNLGKYTCEIPFYVASKGSVEIGIKNEGTALSYEYMCCKNFQLTYFGNTTRPMTLVSSNNSYTPTDNTGTVTVPREMEAGKWYTMVLPFDVPTSSMPEDIEVATLVNEEDNTITFSTTRRVIEAHKPVLVRSSKDETALTFADAIVLEGEPTIAMAPTGGNIKMVGNYETVSVAANAGNYILKNNQFYLVDSENVKIAPFRAYFNNSSSTPNKVRMFIGDEMYETSTAIEGVQAGMENGGTYNLAGQKVNNAYRGIVVKNGKKYINL